MESEIVGRTQRAKDKSPVEREACVAVARMRHKERREKETAEERERRSLQTEFCSQPRHTKARKLIAIARTRSWRSLLTQRIIPIESGG